MCVNCESNVDCVCSAQTTNWADAHKECEIEGGFLAEPKTKELADLLVSINVIELKDFSRRALLLLKATSPQPLPGGLV